MPEQPITLEQYRSQKVKVLHNIFEDRRHAGLGPDLDAVIDTLFKLLPSVLNCSLECVHALEHHDQQSSALIARTVTRFLGRDRVHIADSLDAA